MSGHPYTRSLVFPAVGSLDPLSQPLHAVTFCVVDLETTGGSPTTSTITEVGAATYRAGERLGTFQTLVNPCAPMPQEIVALTGITPAMLAPAPTISQVLPSLAEFVGGAVLVGHNLRFDTSFLDAALATTGRSLLDHLRVDTVPLARRLLDDEMPDCTLGTLAAHLGLAHRPTHRALDDALATAELLHLLLERAAAFGVTLLDDLLALPGIAGHAHAGKLRLTTCLPRSPGAYLVRNRRGEPIHAGCAGDVRRRVRSYFSGVPDVPAGDRRAVGPVLREAHTLEHLSCASGLDAAVAASRLAHALAPRHGVVTGGASEDDDAPGGWAAPIGPRGGRFVVLPAGAEPRLVVGKAPRPRAQACLGPLPAAGARRVAEAIDAAADAAPGPRVDAIVAGLGGRPSVLTEALADRADALRAAGRHAAAVQAEGQLSDLVGALERHRRADGLRWAGRLVLGLPGGGRAELVRGRLVRTWHADRTSVLWSTDDLASPPSGPAGGDPAPGGPPSGHPTPSVRRPGAPESGRSTPSASAIGDPAPAEPAVDDDTAGAPAERPRAKRSPGGAAPLAGGAAPSGPLPGGPAPAGARLGGVALDGVAPPPEAGPLAPDAADELVAVAAWLDAHATEVRLLHVSGEFASRLPRLAAGVLKPADDLVVEAPGAAIALLDPPLGDEPLRCAAC
jgi:DNA polymerase III subunit epsilon